MTRHGFLALCRHFVKQLPPGHGPHPGVGADGKPTKPRKVILFLDGHTSRWSPVGLDYLAKNGVIVFCLPSHTSIWSQPNDAGEGRGRFIAFTARSPSATHTHASLKLPFLVLLGVNKAIKSLLMHAKNEFAEARFMHTGRTMGIGDWNTMYASKWPQFARGQNAELVTGGNVTTSSWDKTGLSTGDLVNSAYWSEAIRTLGSLRETAESEATAAAAAEGAPTIAQSQFKQVVNASTTQIKNMRPGDRVELRCLTVNELPLASGGAADAPVVVVEGEEKKWVATRKLVNDGSWQLYELTRDEITTVTTAELCEGVGSTYLVLHAAGGKEQAARDEKVARLARNRAREADQQLAVEAAREAAKVDYHRRIQDVIDEYHIEPEAAKKLVEVATTPCTYRDPETGG